MSDKTPPDTGDLAEPVPYEPARGSASKPLPFGRSTMPDDPQAVDEPGMAFWIAVRNRTDATSFVRYRDFIDRVLCKQSDAALGHLEECLCIPFELPEGGCGEPNASPARRLVVAQLSHGMHAYELLKTATEIFLLLECGLFVREYRCGEIAGMDGRVDPPNVSTDDLTDLLRKLMPNGRLPYIESVLGSIPEGQVRLPSLPFCNTDLPLAARVSCPCFIELIWSYWHEEGMLVQSINAVSLRFQNRRSGDSREPLANMTIDPLRPLANLLWGYIQDEQHRLSVVRRAHEYDHEYGLTLHGKAVPTVRGADSRSKFVETFHDLLYRCAVFYKEERNLQYVPDTFVLLNAIKDIHQLLAQGAHNQFGDLPTVARQEMLMQQWLLARPQFREFLGRRPMVPYQEDWMANVDALKKLYDWTDESVIHFRNLAVYGEQILLSLRWFNWIDQNDAAIARTWAKYFKPEIQGYIHAYRAVTGIDLAIEPKDDAERTARTTKPSELLRKRLGGLRANGGAKA